MLKIILIRPGASDFVEQARIQGTLDVPLNEHGKGEVARLIQELGSLGMTALYTPECEPAHATAEAIAESLDI